MTYTIHAAGAGMPDISMPFGTFQTRAEAQDAAKAALRSDLGLRLPGSFEQYLSPPAWDVRCNFRLMDRYVLRGTSPRHVFEHKQRVITKELPL